mgnify:CR=1 FL=1
MNIPTHVIDLMIATPSDRMLLWDSEKTRNEIGAKPPAYYEWLAAKCELLSEDKENDWLMAMSQILAKKEQTLPKGIAII